VVGFAKLLEANTRPESNEEHLRTIQLAAEQLLHVINDILQFIRLDAGADRLESLPFNITDLLEDVVAMLGPMAGAKKLDLVLLLHSDLPETMQGDPARLSQVLVNLVNNAIKFTAQGHVLIEASRIPGPEAADEIEISVADTGIGLEAGEQREIFAAFSQSDSSIKRRFGGTGLGLAIAKQLCQLMGGDITVNSIKGEGSVFKVRLPCSGCSAPPAQEPEDSLSGKQVLVYDASPMMRRSLRTVLAGWGMRVFNTGSWDKTLSLLRDDDDTGAFDFLVLSLTFDEQEAEKVAACLRQVRTHYRGAILLLTGSEEGMPPAAAPWDERMAWASKPIRRTTLLRRLRKGLGSSGLPAPVSPPKAHPLRLAGLRILVAEDNELNRQLLHHLLAQEGARMEEAASGQAAIQAAAEGGYDAILMDLHMPEVDGIEAARRIRAQQRGRVPPIIALTADVFGRNDQEDAEACFDDWLLKPADPEQLTQALVRHCRPTQASSQEADVQQAQARPLPPELRARFRREITDQVDRLGAALAENDSAAASLLVHDLKGLVGVYHDPALNRLVQQIESDLGADDRAGRAERLTALRRAVERLPSDTPDDQA
jgi:CheY-like chemotaxis protein/anti-sigma regulatory factor (Ser/Thr protein kinase)